MDTNKNAEKSEKTVQTVYASVREQVKGQYEKLEYTYVAQQKEIFLLNLYNRTIKIVQIVLTAASTVGFFSSNILAGGVFSALALALTLASYEFKPESSIPSRQKMVDQLWPIVQDYESLIVDSIDESLSLNVLQAKRDALVRRTSSIYNGAPRTGKIAYDLANKAISEKEEQTVKAGEVENKFSDYLK